MKDTNRNIMTAEMTRSGRKNNKRIFEWEKKLREDNIRVLKEAFGSDFLVRYRPLRQ